MASDTNNVKIGACKVIFDGLDLGYTKGGVEVDIQTETKTIAVDQFGAAVINEIIIGRSCTVSVPLAETTLDTMRRVMPGANLVVSADERRKVTVSSAIGTSLMRLGRKLALHPLHLPDDDHSEDFILPRAMTNGALSFALKADEERVFAVQFTGYADPTSGLLFVYGDHENAVPAGYTALFGKMADGTVAQLTGLTPDGRVSLATLLSGMAA